MNNIVDDFNALDPIDTQITISARKANVFIEKLDDKSAAEIIDKAVSKYRLESAYGFAWERLYCHAYDEDLDFKAFYNEEAWRKLESMQLNDVIIFFDQNECRSAYLFSNLQDLLKTIYECYSFEFYLTNKNLDYIMAYTHHQYLYICKYK